MSEGVHREHGPVGAKKLHIEDEYEVLDKEDVVGIPDLEETAFQWELHKDNDKVGRVDARHVRMHPEKMRAQLEAEMREAQERKERNIRRDAWKYAEEREVKAQHEAQKRSDEREKREEQARYERQHPEVKHREALRAINVQLSGLLEAQREQKQEFWSFLPGKRRAVAKLEQEITELRTRARVEQMRIADITNEYHADLKGKRTKEALKPFFDTLKRPERPAPTKEDERASADIARDLIRGLYKEKASLQAEREGWSMLVRPFRRYAIETRLEEVDQEIKDLQEEVRKSARVA